MRREIVTTPRPVRKIALWTPWGVVPRDERESAPAEKPRRQPALRSRPAAKRATPVRRRTFEPLA